MKKNYYLIVLILFVGIVIPTLLFGQAPPPPEPPEPPVDPLNIPLGENLFMLMIAAAYYGSTKLKLSA